MSNSIKTKGEADFAMLIDMCNNIGWDNGITSLEKIVAANENAAVWLIEHDRFKDAHKLRIQIIKQNISIGKLKHYRKTKIGKPEPIRVKMNEILS